LSERPLSRLRSAFRSCGQGAASGPRHSRHFALHTAFKSASRSAQRRIRPAGLPPEAAPGQSRQCLARRLAARPRARRSGGPGPVGSLRRLTVGLHFTVRSLTPRSPAANGLACRHGTSCPKDRTARNAARAIGADPPARWCCKGGQLLPAASVSRDGSRHSATTWDASAGWRALRSRNTRGIATSATIIISLKSSA
jgi:hypothetical protein